jgi:hypothetical protein
MMEPIDNTVNGVGDFTYTWTTTYKTYTFQDTKSPTVTLSQLGNTELQCGTPLPDVTPTEADDCVAVEDNCATQPEITTKYTETRIETTIPGETTILRTYS